MSPVFGWVGWGASRLVTCDTGTAYVRNERWIGENCLLCRESCLHHSYRMKNACPVHPPWHSMQTIHNSAIPPLNTILLLLGHRLVLRSTPDSLGAVLALLACSRSLVSLPVESIKCAMSIHLATPSHASLSGAYVRCCLLALSIFVAWPYLTSL